MINLVLNDLGSPTGKGFKAGLKIQILIAYFDFLKAPYFTRYAKERKAPFFSFIRIGFFDDFGVEHDGICAVFVKNNDTFVITDHIGGHTDTIFFMCGDGIQ